MSHEYSATAARMWWPENTFSVTYSPNVDDSLNSISENGTSELLTFGYDNSYYCPIWIWRANNQHAYYNYDPNNASHLTSQPDGSFNTLSLSYSAAGSDMQTYARQGASAAGLDLVATLGTNFVGGGNG